MIGLHQVVKHSAFFVFIFVVKYMALNNMLRRVPLLDLSSFFVDEDFLLDVGLMPTDLAKGFVYRAIAGFSFDHYLMSSVVLRFKFATVHHCAFFESVGYSHSC